MIVFFMVAMAFLLGSGQILLKKGISRLKARGIGPQRLVFWGDPRILSGAALIGGAPLIYLEVLSRTGLSRAYGLNGFTYVLIYFMGIVFLKERGSRLQTLGILCISLGILVWSM